MYFLTAVGMTIISLCLYLFVKPKKNLHFGVLVLIYGASATMWLIDCIKSAIVEGEFLSFEIPLDIWISIWTVVGGLVLYGIMLLIFYLQGKKKSN